LLVTALVSFLPSLVPAQNWDIIDCGTEKHISDVCFMNPDSGWIVGNDTLIYYTSDSGNTWTHQQISNYPIDPIAADPWLLCVDFCDANNGIIGGLDGVIIYTNDGGSNWVQVQWDIAQQGYFDCQMLSPNVGYLAGANSLGQPIVSKTTDGWQSVQQHAWYWQNPSDPGNNYMGYATSLHFFDDTLGLVAGFDAFYGQAVIAKTVNGGSAWQTVFWLPIPGHPIRAMDFPSRDVGYAVGDSGLVLKTIDGGINWSVLSAQQPGTLNDVSFIDDNIGMAAGVYGTIVRTIDGCMNFSLQNVGLYNDLFAVQVLDGRNAYASGMYGALVYTNNGGEPPGEYMPGDANMLVGSWPPQVIGGDVTYLVNYFRGTNAPCLIGAPTFYCAADANGDCQVIGSDVTRMVTYFRGLADIEPCPEYEPAWLTPDDLPGEAPSGWPNCE
jgi:photosystem II stability/assembly factor-like uncharacterized protein